LAGLFNRVLRSYLAICWLPNAEQTFADPTVIPLAVVSLMLSGNVRFGECVVHGDPTQYCGIRKTSISDR